MVYRNVRTLVVSESTHREMVRQLGWRSPVQVVANGTDPAPDADVTAAGQDSTEPRLLVFGRLATHKRVDLVLRAVAELRKRSAGAARRRRRQGTRGASACISLVDELGLGDVVVLHGFLPDADKQAMLHRSRLQVCASDAEGWGQVVIEAATYGVPTLARDVPGLQDSIRPGRTGWLVSDNAANPDAVIRSLVTGIRAALEELADASVRERYRASCRAWGLQFSWGHMRRQVTQVVEEELSRAGR